MDRALPFLRQLTRGLASPAEKDVALKSSFGLASDSHTTRAYDFYQSIFETSAEAIVIANRIGQIVTLNASAERLFGYSHSDLVGENIALLVGDSKLHDDLRIDPMTAEAGLNGEGWSIIGRHKGGSRVDLEMTIAEWRDRDNSRHFTLAFRSSAFRRKRSAHLNEARNSAEHARIEAERANQAKTDFLAAMSHEIRTPLTSITGFTDLLSETSALSQKQKRYIDLIRSANGALLSVVNDVLDFSKVEAGEVTLDPRPFSPADLLNETLAIMRGQATQKGLVVTCQADPENCGWCLGDENRLRQILLNLLNNAVKFTDSGGIAVSLRIDSTSPPDQILRFSVSDTGPGIPLAHQMQLFKRFSQPALAEGRAKGGTGLGLAISKRLVELMGGQIGVSSREGEGAIFWFTVRLPAAAQPPATENGHAPAPAIGLAEARVLLVEDLDSNREIVGAYLENIGVKSDAARSGPEAIERLQQRHYDLVFMDIQMPGMDGVAATRRIRAMPHHMRDVPIIAMTGDVLPQQVQLFRHAGMNGHIAKPVDRHELSQVIAHWLSKLRPASELPDL